MLYAKDVINKSKGKNIFLCFQYYARNLGLCETRDDKWDNRIYVKGEMSKMYAVLKEETKLHKREGCKDNIRYLF